jgi:Tfp pilus assembly protein PilN
MRAVNLLPKDDGQRQRKKQNYPALASTGVAVLVVGLMGVMYFSAKSTAEQKDLELQDAQAELALLPTPADSAAKTASQRQLSTEHEQRLSALSSALTHRVAWDRVLREISLVLPEDVWLNDFAASSPYPAGATAVAPASTNGQAPTMLTINGYTYSHDAVARLMTRLAVIPELQNVWLQQSALSKAAVGTRSVVGFTIIADVRQAGPTS